MIDILLKALQFYADAYRPHERGTTRIGDWGPDPYIQDHGKIARQALAEFEKTKGWRPIETDPKDESVIIVLARGFPLLARSGSDWRGRVTHWMPANIPPPPEGEKS